ncbi:hypothetical protein Lal_00012914 [Lupinus albus]|nr:hypothetical protein Lal_00012914 [Lupinus albus]
MSTRQVSNSNDPVIESREQLVAPMQRGEKPRENWRIGTEHEKFVYSTRDCHAPSYAEQGGIRDLLMALTEYGWEPIIEGGNVIAMGGADGTGSSNCRARRWRTCTKPAPKPAATWRRSRPSATSLASAISAWPVARQAPRRPADHAQGPLRDHAAAHAARRLDGPRHDAAHLHHPDQPRLRERGGHGAEVPRQPGPATAGHRAVRQFAVPRRQAQRLPLVPQPHLVGYRPGADGDAAVRVRGWLRLRTLCRLHARRADVFRVPRRQVYRRRRPVVPRFPGWQAARAARRKAAEVRLDRPSLHRLPRSAAQELPGDARRRWRPVEPHLRAARAVGGPALRSDRARRGLGSGEGLGHGRTRAPALQRAELALTRPSRAAARCATSPAKCCASRAPGFRRATVSTAPATTRRAICSRSTRSSAPARLRPNGCSISIMANGAATFPRCTPSRASESGEQAR